MELVWCVSLRNVDVSDSDKRHGLEPTAIHENSGFNQLVAENADSEMLDSSILEFLARYAGALKEIPICGGSSELDLASFIVGGEEFSSGVGVSAETLSAMGAASVGIAVTAHVGEG